MQFREVNKLKDDCFRTFLKVQVNNNFLQCFSPRGILVIFDDMVLNDFIW